MVSTEKVVLGGDDRLRKDAGDISRGSRSQADAGRENTDGLATTKSERRAMFRDEWTANALPTPPAIPGFHLCWLSTTNSADPIHKRIRMGYVPVSADEMPDFEHYKMKSGEYEGMVSCNEMLLFKVPMDVHKEMLEYFHHDRPMEEEQMIRNSDLQKSQNAVRVADLDDDGLQQIGADVKPVFNIN